MEKRSLIVEEESVAKATAEIGGGEIGKAPRDVHRDFPKPASPADQIDLSSKIQEDQLKSARVEVGEAKEENERLKKVLTRIVKDYQTLQMHFFDIVKQDQGPTANISPERAPDVSTDAVEEPELVSLRLGTSSEADKKGGKRRSKFDDEDRTKEGLTLGLDSRFEGSDNSLDQDGGKDEEAAGEAWPPSKSSKGSRSGGGDEDGLPQAQVKRARVSVRARCDTPTMNDGCQWRKYGQKVSKGNPCPRAYYRCTVAPLCPVRKQVQRCAEDMSILITTYEGTHNHPLPVSATAMASTTSAAACMLTSGPAGSGRLSSSLPSSSSSINACSNYAIADSFKNQFDLPNHLISPSNSHPTITLDLTNKYSPGYTRYSPAPPTTFNFSSTESNVSMPMTWPASYNKSHVYGSLNQSYWQRAAASAVPPPALASGLLSTDTIARAITSDPSFQSALAAAITSYVGARGGAVGSAGAGGHEPRHLGRAGSLGSGRGGGSLGLVQPPPVGVSVSKSASASPVEDMEQND